MMQPFDSWNWPGPGGSPRGEARPPAEANLDRLLRCGIAAALCLCLASFGPPAMMLAVAAELLTLAALGSAFEALLRGEHPLRAATLTAWDQAAVLLAASLLLRFFFGLPEGPATA